MVDKKEIKIFISCHKKSFVPKNDLLIPVQVGAKIAKNRFEDMLHDDEGENISSENRLYCELTTQYWAWKNADADYYGFFHYRRYLSFNPVQLEEDIYGNVLIDNLDDDSLEQLWINESKMRNLISKYELVTTKPFDVSDLGGTVYGHYKHYSPYHRIEDLDLALQIIAEIYPEFVSASKEYVNSKNAYFCNLYIMNRAIFNEYCEWVFRILDEHKRRRNFDTYSIDEARAYGFLSERLFGIFYTYKKDNGINALELQRTLFRNTDYEEELMPAFKENNIPIVLSADKNYVAYVSVLIESIMKNSDQEQNYDIIILHSSIGEKEQNKLLRNFISYANISIRFLDLSRRIENFKFSVNSHFRAENYYRIFIIDILKNYKKVIYLDSDLVVLDDIANLYHTDIGDACLGVIKDIDWISWYCMDEDRKVYEERYLRLKCPYDYFNSGVMIWNIKRCRDEVLISDLYNLAQLNEWLFVDQDVLNIIFESKICFLPMKWNVLMDYDLENRSRLENARAVPKNLYEEYIRAREQPYIVHFAGCQKPWQYEDCDFAEYFWKYARGTNYYEILVRKEWTKQETYKSNVEDPVITQVDNQGIRVKGVDDIIYIDGVMMKIINKFNKMYPIGSRKRNRIRKFVRHFVK